MPSATLDYLWDTRGGHAPLPLIFYFLFYFIHIYIAVPSVGILQFPRIVSLLVVPCLIKFSIAATYIYELRITK